jgi:hypothetical protein
LNRNLLYQVLFRRWPAAAPKQPESGYTVLLPVPADLPVFLKIAMTIVARQDAQHRRETLVLPDASSSASLAAFRAVFDHATAAWPGDQRIRTVPLGPLARAMAQRQKNPGLNHWLQFVYGVSACRTTHALLHDADLFLSDPGFIETQYQRALSTRAACVGISPVWDAWYAENGYAHLVATWEMLFDTGWARSFDPWEHRGHEGIVGGKRHIFDTTLLPQCRTPASRIVLIPPQKEFTHFNYVISTYRWFQKSQGPFEDEHYRLLLVRLLIDAVDDSGWAYALPPLSELARGLTDASARITYSAPATAEHYDEFRAKLERLIDEETLGPLASESLRRGIRSFDEALGWSRSRSSQKDAAMR